jgi:phosphatidyl-myo-inositol dimannoside synthase
VKRERWLALVTEAFGGEGGIAQYNRDFLSALAEDQRTSSVIVMPRHAPGRVVPPSRIRQAWPRSSRLSYAAAALLTALSRPVDVVFCGHLYLAPLAAVIARIKRAKVVVQVHGIEAWQHPSVLQRAAVESAELVLCVSRHSRARVVAWASIARERVLVLPNTVADVFVPGDAAATRAALGLDGKQVLLTVGRMDSRERYKGHDRVIAALPALAARGHDLVYLVVGNGDDRPRLERLALEAGFAERVRFLGTVAQERLAEVYRAADLFLMPSTGEGFGIAFLEAMASGTPALGLNIGGSSDALADGELGTLVSEGALVDAIDRVLSTRKAPRDALSQAVRARFGRDAFAARLRASLDQLRVVA